jgi:integrase
LNDAEANFPFLNVTIRRNAIQFPVVRTDRRGTKSYAPEQIMGFYARYNANGKRTVKPLGKDPVSALTQFQTIEQDFSRIRAGLLPLDPQPDAPKTGLDTLNIQACANDFREQCAARGLRPRTLESYDISVGNFLSSCRRLSLRDVTEKDILDFIEWMRLNLAKRGYGQQANTYRNRLKDINVFFNHYGLKLPLAKKKWPKSMKRNPDKFSMEAIASMMNVADRDEADLLLFFLYTGFRDEEAEYAKYSDLNFRNASINVHDKPEYKWIVKDHEQRSQDIVLPDKFIKRMKQRQARHKKSADDLIFPNCVGNPDTKLIRIIQRLGKRAGLQERIGLHKIRRTFGSTVAATFGIETARIWLGHSNLATTQRYIAADLMTTDHARKRVNKMYEKF